LLALEIVGPVYGTTGYDRHTREFTRALHRLGAPLQLSPMKGWSLPQRDFQEDALFRELQKPRPTDLTLHFTMPTQCEPRAGRVNANYTMFEGDRIPAEWGRRAAEHALIVVPNETCRSAWLAGGVTREKLAIAPLAVDGAFFAGPAEPMELDVTLSHRPIPRPLRTYARRFLHIAELRPRKNLLGLLRTWICATKPEDDAVLVVKSTCFVPPDRVAFEQDLRAMQERLGRGLEDAAPVVMLHSLFDDDQMRALYKAVTHYISLSFGEGWDFPMMEAACCGLDLIAPRHSGYLSYLGEDDALWVPAKLEPASFEGSSGRADRRFFAGIQWWRPDEHAAIEAVRIAVRGERARQSPQRRIMHDFTWENAARKLLEALGPIAPES